MLYLIEGPAGAGKSQLLKEMKDAGQIDIAADTTELWAASGLYERDPATGKYPVRADDDPALDTARVLQAAAVTHGLRKGFNVGVTTSRRGQAERWRPVADDFNVSFVVNTVDPGEDVVRERLADAVTGELEPECERAIGRWYR